MAEYAIANNLETNGNVAILNIGDKDHKTNVKLLTNNQINSGDNIGIHY
jgi:hypothetical protein